MSIFDKRAAFKPFEYKDILAYKDAINHSYWLVSEWNFLGDVQDFHVHLLPHERDAIRNTLLAISQVEVSVKRFWTRLGDRFPRAEFEQVGVTFGESEVRHADAYSHLLEVLGLNGDFERLMEVPAIRGRVDYLTRALQGASTCDDRAYTLVLTLFSMLVENVSLFSQFLIIKSFNKHRKVLKDIDNVVQATQKEETIHALLGMAIIGHIREEHPEWFDVAFHEAVSRLMADAYVAECGILDWIFESGELDFLPKATIREFLKSRLNDGMEMLGSVGTFAVNRDALATLEWFFDEAEAEVSTDFFHKKPVTYSKKTSPVKAEDLF